MNLYGFVGNNGMNEWDILGLQNIPCCGGHPPGPGDVDLDGDGWIGDEPFGDRDPAEGEFSELCPEGKVKDPEGLDDCQKKMNDAISKAEKIKTAGVAACAKSALRNPLLGPVCAVIVSTKYILDLQKALDEVSDCIRAVPCVCPSSID